MSARSLLTPLHQLSATQIAHSVQSGELKAQEVVDAHITQLEAVNPRLNAVVARRYEMARQEALALDRRRARGEALPALAGVPMSIKDALDVQGLPSTGGLTARAKHQAEQDMSAVATLRAAGAIVLAKSNVAQALAYIESDNPLHGRCNHPEREDRSCGGSSGGEAAILASGGSALGLGTDIGGSGRIPAAFCGVVGFKPTAGRLPDPQRLLLPLGCLAIQSQLAPMARRVDDAELLLKVLNPTHFALADSRGVNLRGLRVGVYDYDGLFACSPGIRRAVRQAADSLRAAGAKVQSFSIPDPGHVRHLFYALLSGDCCAALGRLLKGSRRDLRVLQLLLIGGRSAPTRSLLAGLVDALGQRNLAAVLRAMGRRSVDAHWQHCEQQADYREGFLRGMDNAGVDLLLGPVAATPALTHGAAKDMGVPGV